MKVLYYDPITDKVKKTKNGKWRKQESVKKFATRLGRKIAKEYNIYQLNLISDYKPKAKPICTDSMIRYKAEIRLLTKWYSEKVCEIFNNFLKEKNNE